MESDKSRADYLDELLRLSEKREIPYTKKQLEKMTLERLINIYEKHKAQELDELNEAIVDTAIGKFDEFMKGCKFVSEKSDMGKKLQNKKLFRQDVKNLVSWFTPLFPYVGLLEGLVCVASEVINNPDRDKDTNKKDDNEGDKSEPEKREEQNSSEVPDNDARGPEPEDSKL